MISSTNPTGQQRCLSFHSADSDRANGRPKLARGNAPGYP